MIQLLAQSTDFDWRGPLEDALASVTTFVPKLLAFLLILFIARIVAKILRKAATAILGKIKFDEVMDRAGVGAPLERAGFGDSGTFVAMIVYYAVLLLGLQLAMAVFGPNPVSDLINSVVAFIPKAIVAMVIIIVTGLLVRAVHAVLEPFYSNMDWGGIARTVVTVAIWSIGIFSALDQIEVAPTIVQTLFTTLVGSLGLILVIKFGVGGIWIARDRFWPAVYDRIGGVNDNPGGPTRNV